MRQMQGTQRNPRSIRERKGPKEAQGKVGWKRNAVIANMQPLTHR